MSQRITNTLRRNSQIVTSVKTTKLERIHKTIS